MSVAATVSLFILLAAAEPQFAQPAHDPRYCYTRRAEIPRWSDGTIKRSDAIRAAFQITHPCPSTGKSHGPCPGWEVDHVVPLGCGGCDAVWNMQWLPISIKRSAPQAKDRWERRMYCNLLP